METLLWVVLSPIIIGCVLFFLFFLGVIGAVKIRINREKSREKKLLEEEIRNLEQSLKVRKVELSRLRKEIIELRERSAQLEALLGGDAPAKTASKFRFH